MGDIACDITTDNPTTLGCVYLEANAPARQSGLTAGQTDVTNITNVTVDRDPDDRFTLLPNGRLRVNESGFINVDYSIALHRTSAALVTRLYCEFVVNNTVVASDGRYEQIGANHAAVSDALPGAGSWQTLDIGLAAWANQGDEMRPRIDITGPGTVEVLQTGDALGTTIVPFMSAIHFGPGVEPYAGSVYA